MLIAEDLLDHEYVAAHTLGFEALAERVREWTPDGAAAATGLPAGRSASWRATTAAPAERHPPQLRPQSLCAAVRHRLPAGAHRRLAPCRQAVRCCPPGAFPVDIAALERPDPLSAAAACPPRTVNMSQIGEAPARGGRSADPRDLRHNSNPLAVAPDSNQVPRRFHARRSLLRGAEQFQTDTADYADILLPATTQLEHRGVYKAYGHLNVVDNQPAIAPLGEARPNSEVFRLLAGRMGFTEPALFESDDEIAAAAFRQRDPRALGLTPAALASAAGRGSSCRVLSHPLRVSFLPHPADALRVLFAAACRAGPRTVAALASAAARIAAQQS